MGRSAWQSPALGCRQSDVARHVYNELLTHAGGTTGIDIDAEVAAAALRTAILALLAESPWIPPLYGAAYIHTGP